MSVVAALLARRSVPARYLQAPGPDAAQLAAALDAAGRAPDHGQLRPWRFRTVQGAALAKLGELLVRCALARDPATPPEQLQKFRLPASRAPLAIIVSALLRPSPKVPEVEQLLATGASCMNLLNAFSAQGFGAVWLTGANAYDPNVARELGLAADERLLGILYVGSISQEAPAPLARPDRDSYASEWQG
ncbi:MAG TPA: nitroreductase [Steroidobacteraceae bacterium]|nr:nitroreductase [Steroidobacteraceae bacterium]